MAPADLIAYGTFRIDVQALEIRDAQGAHVDVGPQAVRLLLLLHRHLDQVISREKIYEELWPGSEIDVNRGLNTLVRQLRIGLGDSATDPRHIRTYPGRGYRLQCANVTATDASLLLNHTTRADVAEYGDAPVLPLIATTIAPAKSLTMSTTIRSRRDFLPQSFASRTVAAAGVVLALVSGLTFAMMHEETSAVIVQVNGVRTAADADAWREAIRVETLRHRVHPQAIISTANWNPGDSVTAVITVVCEVERDTLWKAYARSTGVPREPERRRLVREAIAAARSNPERDGQKLPTPVELPSSVALELATGRQILRSSDLRQRGRAAPFLARALLARSNLRSVRSELAEALFWAGELDSAYSVASDAITVEPDVSASWFIYGVTAHLARWDWHGARRALARAVQLEPSRAAYHSASAFVEATAGRRGDAIRALGRAISSGSSDAVVLADVGQVYLFLDDAPSALDFCNRAAEIDTIAHSALSCLAEARLAIGDSLGARTAIRTLAERGITVSTPMRSLASEFSAMRIAAATIASTRLSSGRGPYFFAAEALARAEQYDLAMRALREAIVRREPWAVLSTVSPSLRPMTSHPGFKALVAPVIDAGAAPLRCTTALPRSETAPMSPQPECTPASPRA